ncbi:MAG: RNA polymerase sigma-70 factor [Chitinophagaceae bacterium]|nr:RNA polymerase sigma-70 factor [Chitinophagaceae bacterium]
MNHYHELELAAMIKHGNHAAFTELFERYSPVLYAFALRKVDDKEAASDIVQDVFTKIWTKREEITIEQTVQSYLFAAVRNKALDYIAREENRDRYLKHLTSFLHDSLQNQNSADEQVRIRMFNQMIEEEIERLPPRMKEVFNMSRKLHMSYKEIAATLGISEETVKSQVKRALAILRPRLQNIFFSFLTLPF